MQNLSYQIQNGQFDKRNKSMSKSTMTGNISCFWKLFKAPYRKIVHVNGDTVAMIFFVEDRPGKWIPWTGTDYKPCGFFDVQNLPNFIKRHIDFDVMQDYANCRAMGNYKKYSFGLYFENGELVQV